MASLTTGTKKKIAGTLLFVFLILLIIVLAWHFLLSRSESESALDGSEQYMQLSSDIKINENIQTDLQAKIENYYTENGGSEKFGSSLGNGYSVNDDGYLEYEYADIFTNGEEIYAVRLPLLNVYITSGGVEALGLPCGEEYIEDGFLWQEFEKGIVSYACNELSEDQQGNMIVAESERKTDRIESPDYNEVWLNASEEYSYSKLTLAFAGNSVNSTPFRKSALTTYIDEYGNEEQYCAFYDYYGTVVLAKRINYGEWTYQWTSMVGTINDAHNVISIAIDGDGYLHVAISDHGGSLYYSKSEEPRSLFISKSDMIGDLEDNATYPEFYVQPSGDLLFLYRNGSSGNGNLVLNKYDVTTKEWERLYDNLISGEGELSPYWQAVVDNEGRLHLSWVWRENPDMATNFNMSYMVSTDSSCLSFVNTNGESLSLPATVESDVLIAEIPQNSSLGNHTSMTVDDEDRPYVVSYWRTTGDDGEEIVQYQILYLSDEGWIIYDTGIRNTDFELSGTGSLQLVCARPQILVSGAGDDALIYIIFRDDERESHVSLAKLSVEGDDTTKLKIEEIVDITETSMEEWEPSYDIRLWKLTGKLSIFMQREYYASDGSSDVTSVMEPIYIVDIGG